MAVRAGEGSCRPQAGGLLYFFSTHRYSLVSEECHFPLYAWLPDRWRYRLRRSLQGDDIMKLGIDYNQFTHSGLRSCFGRLGFAVILDYFDIIDPDRLGNPTGWKRAAARAFKRFSFLKPLVLALSPYTEFVCIK